MLPSVRTGKFQNPRIDLLSFILRQTWSLSGVGVGKAPLKTNKWKWRSLCGQQNNHVSEYWNIARNVAGVEASSTSATFHATIAPCVHPIARNVARNVASCVRSFSQSLILAWEMLWVTQIPFETLANEARLSQERSTEALRFQIESPSWWVLPLPKSSFRGPKIKSI